MATMVEQDLAQIQQQRERRRQRELRAAAAQKARASRPLPVPLPEGLEERKLLRAERAERSPDVRAARFEAATARVSRAERIRRLEATVGDLTKQLAGRAAR